MKKTTKSLNMTARAARMALRFRGTELGDRLARQVLNAGKRRKTARLNEQMWDFIVEGYQELLGYSREQWANLSYSQEFLKFAEMVEDDFISEIELWLNDNADQLDPQFNVMTALNKIERELPSAIMGVMGHGVSLEDGNIDKLFLEGRDSAKELQRHLDTRFKNYDDKIESAIMDMIYDSIGEPEEEF